jgi:hypothetical protein
MRTGKRSAVGADASPRAPSRLRRRAAAFGLGFALGLAPFLLSFLDSLTYLIPLSLRSELRTTTALLGGFLALVASERSSLGLLGRKVFRAWAFAAPAGLVLLVFLQPFVVRFPSEKGVLASEIIAPPRLAACSCETTSDEECLRELNLDPAVLAQCWDGSRRTRNRIAWSLGYLLAIGGAQSFLCLLWIGPGKVRRAPVAGRTLFLSYSRRDVEFADRLAKDLKKQGFGVWWDCWEMGIGDSFPREIKEALSKSAWFAIILSPNSVDSPWVEKELNMALILETDGAVKILPILHEPCEIPLLLRDKVWANFTLSYEEGLEALLHRLPPHNVF